MKQVFIFLLENWYRIIFIVGAFYAITMYYGFDFLITTLTVILILVVGSGLAIGVVYLINQSHKLAEKLREEDK